MATPLPDILVDIEALRKLLKAAGSAPSISTAIGSLEESKFSSAKLLREAWDVVMVRQTLVYAASNVDYYRTTWKDIGLEPVDFDQISDLCKFPILTKAQVVDNISRLTNKSVTSDEIRCTSGTTGHRLAIYGSRKETEALEAVLQARAALESRKPFVALRVLPAMKRLFRSGSLPLVRDVHNALFICMRFDQGHWIDSTDHFVQVIFDSYSVGGENAVVELVHITPPFYLDFLSNKLLDKSIDIHRSGVREIILSGGFVFENTRRAVTEQWGARLTTSYSCTEVNAECMECRDAPGTYHVGYAMHVEIVSTQDLAPVQPGYHGSILLTSFYPFQQVMPFIRYDTGDVGEWVEGDCSCADLGRRFRVIGRRGDVVDLSDLVGYSAFIGTAHVGEAIAAVPSIPHIPYPRFELRKSPAGIRSEIVLRVEAPPPAAFDSEEARKIIGDRLLKFCRPLASAVDANSATLVVEFVNKGSLENYYRLYPER